MKLSNSSTKQNILTRLNRIEGQVRGVSSMVDTDRECREIIQQLTAIRSAVVSVSQLVLQEYATNCLLQLDQKSEDDRAQLVKDLVDLVGKAP